MNINSDPAPAATTHQHDNISIGGPSSVLTAQANLNYHENIDVQYLNWTVHWWSSHQRPHNWRQVRQAEPLFLTAARRQPKVGTDQATQIQDVDNKGR